MTQETRVRTLMNDVGRVPGARHVVGCCITQATTVRTLMGDVAGGL